MTYSSIRQASLLFLLILTITQNGIAADKLAVVVDVSGSMKNYGAWQADARDAIAAVLAGRPLPSRWKSDPGGIDLSVFSCGPQDRVTLLRFGSVQPTAEYPFFAGIQHGLPSAEVESRFPTDPGDYVESRTNKALAESVAINSATDSNGNAEIIMLSDFYSDASLSDRQIAFINDTEHKFEKSTLATLSWSGNPRVQIKLIQFALRKKTIPPPPVDTAAQGTLHLLPPRFDKSSHNLQLGWSYQGQTSPEKYDLKIMDAQGTTLFSKYGLGGKSVTYPRAASGLIHWTVTAYLPGGSQLEQEASFNVPGGYGPPAWIFVFILLLLALGGGFVWVKRVGLPEIFRKRRH